MNKDGQANIRHASILLFNLAGGRAPALALERMRHALIVLVVPALAACAISPHGPRGPTNQRQEVKAQQATHFHGEVGFVRLPGRAGAAAGLKRVGHD